MLLTIDAGNTNITIGLFDGDNLSGSWRVATDPHRTPDEHASILGNFLEWESDDPQALLEKINDVCICSVVPPLTPVLVEFTKRFLQTEPLVIDSNVDTGITNEYSDPSSVGADRITNAVAAHALFRSDCIIVDFGTATTFDAVTANGTYRGGAIAPGITLATEALYQQAAMLRRVELIEPSQAIGLTTAESMQSGIVFGYVGLVKELVGRFQGELGGQATVVATGGLAELIAPLTGFINEVNPDLTLIGLRLIYERNQNS